MAIDSPLSWDELRGSEAAKRLQPLIDSLAGGAADGTYHVSTVAALLALKGHFAAIESAEDCGVNASRGLACKLVAWQLVLTLSPSDALKHLLFELHPAGESATIHTVAHEADEEAAVTAVMCPPPSGPQGDSEMENESESDSDRDLSGRDGSGERRPLLVRNRREANGSRHSANGKKHSVTTTTGSVSDSTDDGLRHQQQQHSHGRSGSGGSFAKAFMHLNTLEIAAVSEAKKFLAQRVVQDTIDGIWRGVIIFWHSLTPSSVKRPGFYVRRSQTEAGDRVSGNGGQNNDGRNDPWSRLHVPLYMKAFEAAFFLLLLALFYTVCLQHVVTRVTVWEVTFYIFVAGFAMAE